MIAISGDGTTLIDGNLNITRVSKAPMSSGDPLTVWTGTEQISFGIDNQGETNPIPFEPVVMIAATGARRAVPRPAWWQGPWPIPSPHQGGDPQFAATSGNDVLLTDGRPGGFAGLFNPATDTWRRVDSPPIPTNNAQLIDLPNELIVLRSFARTGEPGPEHAVRFDKTTGTWAELTLPSPVPVEQLLQGRDFTDRWLIGNFLGALAVLDKQTGALSTATSADQAAWKSYDSIQSAQLVARP